MNTITSTLVCVAYAIAPRREVNSRVFYGAQFGQEVNLVERNFSSDWVLDVLHTAVRERSTLNRQLAKFLLKDLQQFLHHYVHACYFQVINMDRHYADQHSRCIMSKTKLVVDSALTHSTFLREDTDKFDLKCSRCIGKARTRFITVQHFFLGIEPLKPFNRPKKWDVFSWQIESDLSGGVPVSSASSL